MQRQARPDSITLPSPFTAHWRDGECKARLCGALSQCRWRRAQGTTLSHRRTSDGLPVGLLVVVIGSEKGGGKDHVLFLWR